MLKNITIFVLFILFLGLFFWERKQSELLAISADALMECHIAYPQDEFITQKEQEFMLLKYGN